MIASIAFRKAGVQATAVLGDDRRWTCAEMPAIADALTVLFDATNNGPADGQPGAAAVAAAAQWLDGEATWPVRKPAPPGTIY